MAMALASTAAMASAEAVSAPPVEDEPMVTILPQEVIDALAELDLELSEGKSPHSSCRKTSSYFKQIGLLFVY